MRIVCIGGGPAGLYFSLLYKAAHPAAAVTLFERNRADETFGWGVVFSDQTLGNLAAADPESYRAINASFVHWDDIDVHFNGRTIRAGGQGFAGIARRQLLAILHDRAQVAGVELCFQTEVLDATPYRDADVVVVCDGANSGIRRTYADDFGTSVLPQRNRYVWLGTRRRFD
ncbi:MAG: lycopene cyclase family protein, partial [Vulcanimicrobiaceae bacterium]